MPWIAGLSTLVALGGLFLAYTLYAVRARERDPVLGIPGYSVLEHKYYLDDLYMNGIVYPVRDRVSAAVYWFNQHVLDGVVNGAASVARGLSKLVMIVRPPCDRRGGERRRQRGARVRRRPAVPPVRQRAARTPSCCSSA